MIRNPVKIGTITAAASSVLDLSIPVGHNGTICGLYFQCFASGGTASTVAQIKAAIEKINLSVTHKTEGGFSILNDVSPTFLFFRELFYGKARGLAANEAGMMHYDPSAAMRGDEAAQNIRNLGTRDLSDMVLRMTFASSITSVARIDVFADIDYNLIADLGEHVRIGRVTAPVTIGGGEVEVTNLPRLDKRFGYEALHIHSGGLTDMTVTKTTLVLNGNDFQLRDVPKAVTDRQLALQNRSVADAGFASLDFAKEDNPLYFLPGGMSEIKLIPTFLAGGTAAAGTVSVWYETIKKVV
ncbi:MAG: hypothetical protein WCH86_02325 [Kiritimatiellales bacterium]